MAKLPKELIELLVGGHLVWVATVDADGMPNISIKGSGALLDDEHLYFADMFSRKTRDNIAHNGRVAVGIHDRDAKVALQVKGHAELIDSGPIFDTVTERRATLCAAAHLPPMKYVVRISVDSVWDMGPGPDAGKQIA